MFGIDVKDSGMDRMMRKPGAAVLNDPDPRSLLGQA
jgi:hypothetical protein